MGRPGSMGASANTYMHRRDKDGRWLAVFYRDAAGNWQNLNDAAFSSPCHLAVTPPRSTMASTET